MRELATSDPRLESRATRTARVSLGDCVTRATPNDRTRTASVAPSDRSRAHRNTAARTRTN